MAVSSEHANYFFGEPSVTKSGIIYCNGGTYKHDELWAFNPDGTLKWTYKIQGSPGRSPAIDTDGTIYFGGRSDSTVYALNPDGSKKWSFKTDSPTISSLVLDNNSVIYCPSHDGLYAINNDGTLKWKYSAPGNYYYASGPVSIGGENLLYFPIENTLYALSTLSGESDLRISGISFKPEVRMTPGVPIKVIAEVEDLTGNTSTKCNVSFYINDSLNPIGNTDVFVQAGRMGYGEITWNTDTYSPDDYTIIAKISDTIPVEIDTTNNEKSAGYSFLPFIQSRVDAASNGDTVWVDPGIYYENLLIFKDVVVISKKGPDETTIDGMRKNRVVGINAGVIDGFTITNGNGGVSTSAGSPTVRNNKIIGNNASLGGGINAFGLNVYALIERNLIMNNTATLKGSGIYAPNSNAKIINTTIINNSGDGINTDAFPIAFPTIVNCIIWGNGDDLKGQANATYSCIEDGDTGFGNISSDPDFMDPANGDYRLRFTSPCLDAGNPTISDPDGSRSDMGAFPAFQGGGRFGAPVNLTAVDAPNDDGGQISLMWESPPPILEVSADSLVFDIWDLGWAFFLKNSGLGMLNWTAASDQNWLELIPQGGTTMLGNGQLFAFASRKGLAEGDYNANIQIASNGGNKILPVILKVGNTPEPGAWSGSGVSFDVTEDMSRIFDFDMSVGPSNNRYTYLNGSAAMNKSDQTFSIESGDVKITGKFDTRTSISGTYVLPPHSGNWSASWTGNSNLGKENSSNSISGQLASDISLIMGYNVYRGSSSGNYDSVLVSVAGNKFSYTDTSVADGKDYYYVVKAFDQDNNLSVASSEAGPVSSMLNPTSVMDETALPVTFALEQNYPNPFNPETTIRYQLPIASEVKLQIYNLLGQRIVTLVDNQQPAGFYSVQWGGKDKQGYPVASGVYLYSIKAENFVQVRKLILVK